MMPLSHATATAIYVLFNKKAQELFGYTEEDIMGKKFHVVPPETLSAAAAAFSAAPLGRACLGITRKQ